MPVIVLADDSEELLVVVVPEHGDDGDADDANQSHEEHVLHEAGSPFVVAEAGPEPAGEEFVLNGHRLPPIILVLSRS